MKTNYFLLYSKYIISVVSTVIICFGEQIYISEPVIVEDFVGSGFVGDVDGVGNQTMFEVTEKETFYLTSDQLDNIYFLSGKNDNKSLKKVSKEKNLTTIGKSKFTFCAFYNSDFYLVSEFYNRIYKSSTFLNSVIHRSDISPKLASIGGMCIDSFGNIYLSFTENHKIYRLKPNGDFEVFAGSGNIGSADGTGIFSSFNKPKHLAVDSSNNIYVNDSNNWAVRMIDSLRNVKTFAGRGRIIGSDNLDGPRNISECRNMNGLSCDSNGNVIVASGNSIRIIDKTGYIKTIAGDYFQPGYKNDIGENSLFQDAVDIIVLKNEIYVAESKYPRIRKITIGKSSAKKPFDNIKIKLSAGITINGTVGKKYNIESSSNGGKQWNALTELELSKTPYTWYDENSVGTNNLYRVFESP
jgi:hypothetical protein